MLERCEGVVQQLGAGDKHTISLDYRNHYNKSLNKCFILIEYGYWLTASMWANDMTLWDVHENATWLRACV